MKTRMLILGVILIFVVLVIVGNNVTIKKAYAQEKPTVKDLVGTWVNEEMIKDKLVVKSDGTWEYYYYTTDNLPYSTGIITIKDSWVDKNGNKYFKIHTVRIVLERPQYHYFELWRINESGTVLEFNGYEDFEYRSEKDDVPEKYPTKIDPNSYDFVYRIYYRQ